MLLASLRKGRGAGLWLAERPFQESSGTVETSHMGFLHSPDFIGKVPRQWVLASCQKILDLAERFAVATLSGFYYF